MTVSEPHTSSPLERERESVRERHTADGDKDMKTLCNRLTGGMKIKMNETF